MKNIKNSFKTYAVEIITCIIVYTVIIALFACNGCSSDKDESTSDSQQQTESVQNESADSINPNMATIVFKDYVNRTYAFKYDASQYKNTGISDIDKYVRMYTYLALTDIASKYTSTVNKEQFKTDVYNDLRIRCAKDSIIVTNFELTEVPQ